MKENFLIKTVTGQQRIDQILQELNIVFSKDPLIYVKLGYKNLSLQDKETYYLLWDLSRLNKKQKDSSTCRVGFDYLSTIFDTTEDCQIKRIRNLIKSGLIESLGDSSYYILDPPLPDKSFFKTSLRLLRRKRLSEYINIYNNCYNPIMRLELIIHIKRLQSRGVKHKDLKKYVISAHTKYPKRSTR